MSRRFLEALKSKYGTPRAAMAALGLDMALLRDEPENDLLHKHADRVVDALLKRFGTPQRVLAKLGMDEARLTEPEHMKSDPRDGTGGEIEGGVWREGEDRDPPIEPPSPEQNLGSDDEMFDPLRAHLRDHGMSEDEVEQAIDVARRHVAQDRRRRMNGKDRLPERVDVQDRSDDKMPLRGGRFDRPRFSRDTEVGNNPNQTEYLVDHGLDGIGPRGRAALDEMRKNLARIGHEPEPRPLSGVGHGRRQRFGMDKKPSLGPTEAQVVRLHRRFPGLSLIGDPSSDGPGISARKSCYEV